VRSCRPGGVLTCARPRNVERTPSVGPAGGVAQLRESHSTNPWRETDRLPDFGSGALPGWAGPSSASGLEPPAGCAPMRDGVTWADAVVRLRLMGKLWPWRRPDFPVGACSQPCAALPWRPSGQPGPLGSEVGRVWDRRGKARASQLGGAGSRSHNPYRDMRWIPIWRPSRGHSTLSPADPLVTYLKMGPTRSA